MIDLTKSDLNMISAILWCEPDDILIASDETGGMTNSSVRIRVKNKQYIVRKPGKGSDKLVDREQERKVYSFLYDEQYDKLTVAMLPSGLKISKYIVNAHNCDPNNNREVSAVMTTLKEFHMRNYRPDVKYFNLLAKIDEYRELACIRNAVPCNKYEEVYNRCLQVAAWIERQQKKICLCQIDCNPDNAIFAGCSAFPHLIDWEYAGLQDPHLDIAMFAVYCGYDVKRFDELINTYFNGGVENVIRLKIYGYAALAGMLWYNWCVYKERCGITYGEYAENQFKAADKYSRIVLDFLRRAEHF